MLYFICEVCGSRFEDLAIGKEELTYLQDNGKLYRIKSGDTPCHNCLKEIKEAEAETIKRIKESKKNGKPN